MISAVDQSTLFKRPRSQIPWTALLRPRNTPYPCTWSASKWPEYVSPLQRVRVPLPLFWSNSKLPMWLIWVPSYVLQ